MATQLFMRSEVITTPVPEYHPIDLAGNPSGSAWGQSFQDVQLTRGASATTFAATTVAGPTSGVNVTGDRRWITPPISSAFTLSGTITFNFWGFEQNMTDNVAINAWVQVFRANGGGLTTIIKTARTIEMALTTPAVNNFTGTPTSTSILEGDRLSIVIFGGDAGTMSAGGQFTLNYAGPTAAVSGDTYVSFTENFGFYSAPSGTQLFLTQTNTTAVAGSNLRKEMWTSAGDSTSYTVGHGISPSGPEQWTDTNGGTTIDWFTRPLTAFTLSGAVLVASSITGGGPNGRFRISIVDSSGTVLTDWAEMNVTVGNTTLLTGGPSAAVGSGQFLRCRWFAADTQAGAGVATSAQNFLSSAMYLQLTQTVTEATFDPPPVGYPKRRSYKAITAQ